jgi:phospholipid/cholesterol/gamma-HCH transport system substrate-binding protein
VKRLAAIVVALIASVAILATGSAAGGDEGTYEVRAIFDNAGFLVEGEEVRAAGANIGVVAEVTVTGTEEAARADGSPDPGKAVLVLRIDDPAFQDFREDATCLVRPQSLIGEKFVECEPTQPRAAGSEAPPELAEVPEGEPGEGQRLLPLEQNGKAVDLDLLNNIMEEPYPDRFRLILNDLGAGLAARGEELAEIIERANPALRETNEVLAVLSRQNRVLAGLASDSDAVIGALAREREHISGFINQSDVVGSATAERSSDLEQSFARFPSFLRELRSTMGRLDEFSTTATPVFSDLGDAAPSLTRATKALGPFSNAGTGALTSLGDAAEESGPLIVAADPVIRQVRGLAKAGKPATKNLAKLLRSLRKTEGFRYVTEFIFNSAGTVNAFDPLGHFLRVLLPLNNCVDYESIPEPGCSTNFALTRTAAQQRAGQERKRARQAIEKAARESGAGAAAGSRGEGSGPGAAGEPDSPSLDVVPSPATPPQTEVDPGGVAPEAGPSTQGAGPSARRMRAARELLDFLIGEPRAKRERRR